MKIIISPAKKMNVDTDSFRCKGKPAFLEDTRLLMNKIKSMSLKEATDLWKCNEKIAALNFERFENMDIDSALTPAVMTYEGLQYQHMSPGIFTEDALDYIDEHLRILSGFYGVLRPFDAVTPYRLEMQAKLSVNGCKDLYEFWGDRLYKVVLDEDRTVINLASKEYSKCIEKYVTENDRFITVEFGELKNGKLVQKGTFAKMARGEMVRFMAENKIEDVEEIKKFSVMNLRFNEEFSNENKFVFTLK